jgi:plasmid stabilization system protein ParE
VNALVFHPEALVELQEQAVYYEERSEGLGERFVSQVEAAAGLAASMPGIGSPYKHRTRRVFPKDFPFSVVYREIGDGLVIVAVAAFRRKPGYWRNRK